VSSADTSPAGDPRADASRADPVNRRERAVIVLALLAVTAIAWLYLLALHQDMDGMAMDDMPGMAMPMAAIWTPMAFALTFAMWWVMMLGMMVPSATPMIVTFATLNRSKRTRGQSFVPASVFTLGYVIAWGTFSIGATVVQWALDRVALLSPELTAASPVLSGALLILSGLYQFTPLKRACLRGCRSPFAFVLNHWRDGWSGASRMGLEHGAYCLGCCWALMALLFVVGVMNLLWVAGIAVFVFAEKLLPGGVWIGRAGGGAMVGFGVFLLTGG
jgi:predicted metal-binding membrane protein